MDEEEGVAPLMEELLKHCEVLIEYPELWGRLLVKADNYSGMLRKAFLQAAKMKVRERRYWSPEFEFHPFRLLLPQEASLLVPLMKSLCAAYIIEKPDPYDVWISEFRVNEERLRTQFKTIADPLELISISNQSGIDIEIKAAALFMSLLHPHSKQSLEEAEDRIVDLYSPKFGRWYFRAIIMGVTLLTTDESPVANSLVAKILNVAREDYAGRKQLDGLLNRWRENSYAPVQKAGVQSEWLRLS